MSLLLRAITPAADAAASQPSGQNLVCIHEAGLTAWATGLGDKDAAPFTRADMLDHHRIVTQLFGRVESCLPARFPTWAASEATITAQLRGRSAELKRQLEHVRGCAELAITATWTTPDEAPHSVDTSTPGRRYLLERQQALAGSDRRRQRAQAVARALEAIVSAELLDERLYVCPAPEVALSVAFLVRRTTAASLAASLPRTYPDVRILVSGPWPPYTFAGVSSG